tara:strand:+ start:114 stop:1019 length:906 start_codon:yes stop_codon:yes gene_type:complete
MDDKFLVFLEENKDLFLEDEDKEFYEFCKSVGSPTDKKRKADVVSLRVSKRFRWALEIFKRYIGEEQISDGVAVETLVWTFFMKENKYAHSLQEDRSNLLTKFFLEGATLDSKGSFTVPTKFMSVVELSWSPFYILRIIKLEIIGPELLKPGEKFILKHLKERKGFWAEDKIDSNFIRPLSLVSSLSSKGIERFTYDDITEDLVDSENPNLIELIDSNLEKTRKRYFHKIDDDRIKDILDKDKFDLDYINHDRKSYETSITENTFIHFPLEIKRLRSLSKKAKNESEIKSLIEEFNKKKEA